MVGGIVEAGAAELHRGRSIESLDSREIFPTSVFRRPPSRLLRFFSIKSKTPLAQIPYVFTLSLTPFSFLSLQPRYMFKINVQCTYGFLRLARTTGMCAHFHHGSRTRSCVLPPPVHAHRGISSANIRGVPSRRERRIYMYIWDEI